jgi:glycosyltransferase involved in cell wall biosynthesis
MENYPLITIVTPSYNQGKYIAETIESIMAQNYPNLEHIVMDGGSTDDTLKILKKYPHLIVVSERDKGQADAINKGLNMAKGAILGFLNSDDTFLPGALHIVAKEIDPARGRFIVTGGCRFVDADGNYTGIKHPSYFESHKRMLQIWKGHGLPQPSTFWAREVWEKCGPIDIEAYHPDYDLFCRFSKKYAFHIIEPPLATYRLHDESKTMHLSEAERLADSIATSRKHWGSPFSLIYWQLTLSLIWYRLDRTRRGRNLLYTAREYWRQSRYFRSVFPALTAALMAPDVVFLLSMYSLLRNNRGRIGNIIRQWMSRGEVPPASLAFMERTEAWEDGWVGPLYEKGLDFTGVEKEICLAGFVPLRLLNSEQSLNIALDEQTLKNVTIKQDGDFSVVISLPALITPGRHNIHIKADKWFIPHVLNRQGDYRPLAWRLQEFQIR